MIPGPRTGSKRKTNPILDHPDPEKRTQAPRPSFPNEPKRHPTSSPKRTQPPLQVFPKRTQATRQVLPKRTQATGRRLLFLPTRRQSCIPKPSRTTPDRGRRPPRTGDPRTASILIIARVRRFRTHNLAGISTLPLVPPSQQCEGKQATLFFAIFLDDHRTDPIPYGHPIDERSFSRCRELATPGSVRKRHLASRSGFEDRSGRVPRRARASPPYFRDSTAARGRGSCHVLTTSRKFTPYQSDSPPRVIGPPPGTSTPRFSGWKTEN